MIWCVIAAVGMFVLATAAAVGGHGTTSAFLYGSAVMFARSAGNLRADRRPELSTRTKKIMERLEGR